MVKKIFMGEGKNDYSAMQGPCSSGYHIPSRDDWEALDLMMSTLGMSNLTGYKIKLHIPITGYRWGSDGAVNSRDAGAFLSSTTYSGVNVGVLTISFMGAISWSAYQRANANSIRAFKDVPMIPDDTWVTEFDGSSIATGAGIFHNTTDGVLSISSDGISWITIQDKNLGATVVYNDGDTRDQTNCGNYYQRGNDYGFPFNGSVTTSSTQVDTSTYGPSNHYNSGTFITINGDWSSVQNDNLRGGVTGVQKVSNVSNIYLGDGESASKGPCPIGFHVPSMTEIDNLFGTYGSMRTMFGTPQYMIENTREYLKMPLVSSRDGFNGGIGIYRANQAYIRSGVVAHGCGVEMNYNSSNPSSSRVYIDQTGCSDTIQAEAIRPFKDVPVIPDETWTMLYDYSTSPYQEAGTGIFWNQDLGLISICTRYPDDLNNWITIADKNLGATQIYNYGDALTEANCGKCFQRGNNYAFSWDTSTRKNKYEQVDASAYGPGNWYKSDSFINADIYYSYVGRDSSENENLRGYQTGASTRISNVLAAYQGEEIIFGEASNVPIKRAGIYHNPTLGLISLSSDGKSRITIADKNLGATVVYNDGDTLSQSNCGNHYQRGNDYGFQITGSVTTSSTQVDASTYGPSNHYNSSTFIITNDDWSSVQNDNLWGGEETVNTDGATQGPCPSGYHVPSNDENVMLKTIMTALGINTGNGECMKTYLKMPYSGLRINTTGISSVGTEGRYWSSSVYNANAYCIRFYPAAFVYIGGARSYGYSIRPFKNVPVPPKGDWTPLYVASNSNLDTIPGISVVINPNDPGNIELY